MQATINNQVYHSTYAQNENNKQIVSMQKPPQLNTLSTADEKTKEKNAALTSIV